MEERQVLPNPNLDAEQHLKVLKAMAEALDYEAAGDVGYRPIYKILNNEDKTIRSNQIWPALDFFASLRLVHMDKAGYQAAPTPAMIEWAGAVRDGDAEKAKEIMADTLHATWIGQAAVHAAQSGRGDPAGLAQVLKQAAGYGANNDDKTLKSVEALAALVDIFGVTEGITVAAAPLPPSTPPEMPASTGADRDIDQPVRLPVVPEADEDLFGETVPEPAVALPPAPPSARPQLYIGPAPAQEPAARVQISISLALPADSDEVDGRRLGRALRALLDEVGAGADIEIE